MNFSKIQLLFLLSGGQVHDSKMEILLLQTPDIEHSCVLADRACGNKDIRSCIHSHNAEYVIPSKQNTKNDGPVAGTFTRKDIGWNAFSIRSSKFIILLPDTTSLLYLFSLSPSCCYCCFVEMTWPEDFSDRP